MTYYADTSWWLALVYQHDIHHERAWRLFDLDVQARVLWTPWQRVEVFNVLYQVERVGYLEPGDAQQSIRRLEKEVRLGYWTHREFHWTKAIQLAGQIAQEHGPTLPIRGMDLFHVAIALTVRSEAFLTFDADQEALAQASGLSVAR